MKIPGILIICIAAFKMVTCASTASNNSSEPSSGHSEEHNYLVDYLMGVLEILRDNMKKGVPSMHIPPLEPLEAKNINIKLKENFVDADIDIKKITITGLSGFQINDISPDIENLYLRMNLSCPQVEAFGEYKLNGRLAVIFPLSGDGDFHFKVTKATVSCAAQFEILDDVLQLKDLDLDADWDKVIIYLENFLENEKLSQNLQKTIPHVSKRLFKRFKPLLLNMLKRELMKRANSKLQKPEFRDLIRPFLPDKEDSEY